MRCKILGALCCVIVICRLTAAKLGRRECGLLHLDGNRGMWDPNFLHATQGVASTVNPPASNCIIRSASLKIVST